jgi:tyrosinase
MGGNGTSINNCVTTGPIANRVEHVGPLEKTADYCFARKWNDTKGLDYGARSHADDCYEYGADDFESCYGCMAYYPHISGHQATGGVVRSFSGNMAAGAMLTRSRRRTSTHCLGPSLYPHHNYLDRLYWQ